MVKFFHFTFEPFQSLFLLSLMILAIFTIKDNFSRPFYWFYRKRESVLIVWGKDIEKVPFMEISFFNYWARREERMIERGGGCLDKNKRKGNLHNLNHFVWGDLHTLNNEFFSLLTITVRSAQNQHKILKQKKII